MSEPNAPVRLDYRHVPLAEPPTLQESGDGVFVPLAAPPPVRTVLRVVMADGTERALEVTRVVEVEYGEGHGERGFYARYVDDEALTASHAVGSEHLGSAEAVSGVAQAVVEPTGEPDGSDVGNAAMAMPAPVLMDEEGDEDEDATLAGDAHPDDELSSGSEEGRDADAEAGSDGHDAEPGSDARDADSAGEAGTSEPEDDPGTSGRRSRKRRAKKSRK